MFRTHHNLSDEINRNIVRSEIEGGVFLKDLPGESTLEVATQNRRYTVVLLGDGQALIRGILSFVRSRYWCGSADRTGADRC